MIKCEFEQIPKETGHALLLWLGKDEYQTLVRIISGRLKKHQADALAAALQSEPHNLKAEAANAEMLKAQRYQHCLEVLTEVKKHPVNAQFEIAVIT